MILLVTLFFKETFKNVFDIFYYHLCQLKAFFMSALLDKVLFEGTFMSDQLQNPLYNPSSRSFTFSQQDQTFFQTILTVSHFPQIFVQSSQKHIFFFTSILSFLVPQLYLLKFTSEALFLYYWYLTLLSFFSLLSLATMAVMFYTFSYHVYYFSMGCAYYSIFSPVSDIVLQF